MSAGYLSSPNLFVWVEREGRISLKNTGHIRVDKTTGIDLEVKKIVGEVKVG